MFVTPAFAQAQETEEMQSGNGAAEMHTETGVADHGGGHEAGFPPFDSSTFPSQLLWLAITFGLFYIFMNKVVVPRIGGILEHRRDRIAKDLDEANDAIETMGSELAIAAGVDGGRLIVAADPENEGSHRLVIDLIRVKKSRIIRLPGKN